MKLPSNFLIFLYFLRLILHSYMNCHTYFSVYLRRGCVLIAGGTAPNDVAPASSVKPAAPRLHLTLNHLIFHKVLGKGSFGKVGGILPVSQAFPQTSSVFRIS